LAFYGGRGVKAADAVDWYRHGLFQELALVGFWVENSFYSEVELVGFFVFHEPEFVEDVFASADVLFADLLDELLGDHDLDFRAPDVGGFCLGVELREGAFCDDGFVLCLDVFLLSRLRVGEDLFELFQAAGKYLVPVGC